MEMSVTTASLYVEEIARTAYLKEFNTNHAGTWESSTEIQKISDTLMLLSPFIQSIEWFIQGTNNVML